MARAPNPKVKEAEELFRKGLKLIEIANRLEVPEGTVRRWKSTYKWDNERSEKENERSHKRGAPTGNKNAVGNKSSTKFKPGTQAAYRTGLFSKYMPKETLEIITAIEDSSPLDILWDQIMIAYTAICRAQQIMYVKDINDMTKTQIGEKNGDNVYEEKWEVQQAWDKQANFLKSQARAQSELRSMIKQYNELINEHPELATEEQKNRIEKLKVEIDNAKKQDEKTSIANVYNGIPANMIAPAFIKTYFDICEHGHDEYAFPGGRGSTKSSFISLTITDLLEKNPDMHAAVYRQVGDTLRDSVYAQLCWAIQALGLEAEYKCTVSPMEITKKSTGQKIFFRGCDDPMKSKGIKAPFGYIGILWFEELDQYKGPEAVRTVTQSVIRGGDKCYIFKSFNPPKSATNWANKYIKIPKETMLVTESTYLEVPKQWLGKVFLEEAEYLKEVNPTAYENEYMGVANGSGGNIFDNVEIRAITDEEISQFDRIYFGLDFGWFPDPNAWTKSYYNANRHELYIFDEHRCNKTSNEQMYKILTEEKHMTCNDLLTCDSAEQKSIGDLKAYGLFARGAEKGPGSVEYSMKWLQSLSKIVIDNARCPNSAEEFMNYEYERDKEGNIISGYPDKDNHFIDSIRYALNKIWKKKGQ